MPAPRPVPSPRAGPLTRLLGILTALAAAWTLREMPMVTMPAAWALLVALAVWPVSAGVAEAMPRPLRWLGPAAAMALVAAILFLFGLGLWLAGEQVVRLGAEIGPRLDEALARAGLPGFLSDRPLADALERAGSQLTRALSTASKVLAGLVLIFFLILLMLTEAGEWDDKIAAATGGHERRWAEIGRSVGQKFRIFFFTRLFLGTVTALLYVGWLALFGVDYLLLWGLLAVLLNFIPTVGSIVAGAIPVLFVLVQRDFGTALLVGAGLLAIEQVMGNFVDPKVMGRRLSLSPLVVLLSLLFWSWVWGIPGAFLAAPMTVLIVIVFAHFEPLERIALLLTRERSLEALEEYRRVD